MSACDKGVHGNTCGGGRCVLGHRDESPSNGTFPYHCDCAHPLLASVQGHGLEACMAVNVCEQFVVNTCLAGSCVDTLDGGYTCACALGFFLGAYADGTLLCRPLRSTALSAIDN